MAADDPAEPLTDVTAPSGIVTVDTDEVLAGGPSGPGIPGRARGNTQTGNRSPCPPGVARRLLTAVAAVACLCGDGGAPPRSYLSRAWAAAAEPSESLQQTARRLVRQLDDEQLAVRNEAEQALIRLGPDVLPLLPEATQRRSAEVKHRVARVQHTLEQARADAAMQPSRVTLPDKTMPLAELLADIERQTGNELHLRDALAPVRGDTELGMAFAAAPFWSALDQLLDQVQLTTYHFSRSHRLVLVAAEAGQLPRYGRAAYAGPLRFEATRVDAHRQLRKPTRRALNVTVEVAWEPRLTPIGLSQPLRDVRAFDPQGRPIVPSDADIELTPSVPEGTTSVELQIPFALPPRSITKIARLEGTLIVMMPGAIESFRFDQLTAAAPVEKRKGTVAVTVDKLRKNRGIWELRVRVRYDRPSAALESHRGWIFRNECYVVGADGKHVQHGGFETTRQTETEVGLAYLFDLPEGPDGLSFVYKTPASIVRMPVAYVLRDILLP